METMSDKIPKSVREYFSKLGKANGSKGGKIAARNMTAAQLSDRGRKAVKKREENRKLARIAVDGSTKTV
jgi:hypothetical protein